MSEAGTFARICVKLAACGFLAQCTPTSGVSVTNNFDRPMARVAIRDARGVACVLERLRANTTAICAAQSLSAGKVTYEISAANFRRSGLLGFVNRGGYVHFSLVINKNGSVSTGATAAGIGLGAS